MTETTRQRDGDDALAEQGQTAGPGGGDGPVRRCLVTRVTLPKPALLRFVVAPDGGLTPDLAGKLPGRGLYLLPRGAVLRKATAKNLFAKAARRQVSIPEGLPSEIERQLRRRCIDLLSLARRAGDAVAGFEKVRAWLQQGRAALLVEADDGADGGREKLRRLMRGLSDGADPAPRIAAFADAGTLGAAFGRDHVVHAALRAGGLADRLALEARRLQDFLAVENGSAASTDSGRK